MTLTKRGNLSTPKVSIDNTDKIKPVRQLRIGILTTKNHEDNSFNRKPLLYSSLP